MSQDAQRRAFAQDGGELAGRTGRLALVAGEAGMVVRIRALRTEELVFRVVPAADHANPQLVHQAGRLLLKVPILYPDSEQADDALLLAARARLRQGREDQAARQLRLLLEKYPGSELRSQAEKLLASLEGGAP